MVLNGTIHCKEYIDKPPFLLLSDRYLLDKKTKDSISSFKCSSGLLFFEHPVQPRNAIYIWIDVSRVTDPVSDKDRIRI